MGDLLSGLGVGVAYGLLAAALTVASRATRTLHLAIGPAVVVGAMVHLVLSADGRAPFLVSLALGVAVGAVASAITEPLVLRRLDREPDRSVGMFVVGAIFAALAARSLGARTVRPTALVDFGDVTLAGTTVPGAAIGALVVGLPVAVGLAWVVEATRWGARVRVVGGSVAAAERVGIPAGPVRLGALAVAGGVGTVAVLLAAPLTLLGIPQAAGITLRAIVAAFVARDRPLAAIGIGVVLGVSEAGAQSLVPSVGADAAVGLVTLGLLLWRGADSRQAWGRTW